MEEIIWSIAANYINDETAHVIHFAEAAVENADEWVAHHSHDVFDKSGAIAHNAESAIDEVVHKTHNTIDQALKETLEKVLNYLIYKIFITIICYNHD